MGEIQVKRTKRVVEAIVPGDKQDARILWRPEKDGFILKFKCAGRWYYQWLMWSCRAGRKSYYRPMVALYRALRHGGEIKGAQLRHLAS